MRGARCAPGTSTPALARWRTALASTTNLVIGYLRSGVGASQQYRCAPPRSTPAAPHGAQESSGTITPLAAYQQVLADRVCWHVVFVVPTAARLSWLRRVARPNLAGRAWGVVLADLESAGLDAPVVSPGRSGQARSLRSILDDPRPRRTATPVCSDAWIELLGSGGGEELDEVLR